MARTVAPMARDLTVTRHWSGYRTNSYDDKVARGMHDAFMALGFSEEAAKWLYSQGLKKPERLARQTDETIDEYIRTCRKPGGGAQGHVCPMDAVALLKMAVWGAKHYIRVTRKLDPKEIDEDWCLKWQNQIDLEKNWDSTVLPDEYPKAELAKKPGKFFEDLENLLGRMRCVTGVPLLRVVRDELLPGDEDCDSPCGTSDSDYLTIDDEMIDRAPIIIPDEELLLENEEEQEKTGPV
jgi:hypothetical protein